MRILKSMLSYNFLSKYTKLRFILGFILVLSNISISSAQADSLLAIYNSTQNIDLKVKTLTELSNLYNRRDDVQNTVLYSHKLLDLAASKKDTQSMINAYKNLGGIYFFQNIFDTALNHYTNARLLFNKNTDSETKASIYYNIGSINLSLYNTTQGYKELIDAVKFTKECECHDVKLLIYATLSYVYSDFLNDVPKSLFWNRQALPLINEGIPSNQAIILTNISSQYIKLNQLDSATYYANWAYNKFKGRNDYAEALALCGLCDVLIPSNKPDLALKYALKAYNIANELKIPELNIATLLTLGKAQIITGDTLNGYKNLSKVEQEIITNQSSTYRLVEIYKTLSEIEQPNKPKLALQHLQKYVLLKDSISEAQSRNYFAIFSLESNIALMEAENKLLRSESDKKTMFSRFLLYALFGTLIGLGLVLYLYRKNTLMNKKLKNLNQLTELQNQQLLQNNRQLKYFTNTLSHDALSYINKILNYVTLAKDSDTESKINFIEKIYINASRLKTMSNNLIKFNKIGQVPNPTNLNLNHVISETVEEVDNVLMNALLQIHAPEYINIHADKEFVKQILRNLIINASNFKKTTDMFKLEISIQEKSNFVEIQIKDNGIGIASDMLPTIFSEFTKLKKESEGSGLGLYICRQLIEVMGGQIWVESELNTGTTFYFTLPKAA